MIKDTFYESDIVVFEASPQSFKPNQKEDYTVFLKICSKRLPEEGSLEESLSEEMFERLERRKFF
jgi:hypothetical protein